MTTEFTSTTTLRPPWLNVWRGLWALLTIGVAIVFFAGGLPMLNEPLPRCTTPDAPCAPYQVSAEDFELAQQSGLPVGLMRFIYFLFGILPNVCFYAVGVFIFLRKSDDWVALILSVMLVSFTVEGIRATGLLGLMQSVLSAPSIAAYLVLPFIFPSGRFVPRWTRTLVLAMVIVLIVPFSAPTLLAGTGIGDQMFAVVLLVPFLIWFVLAGYAVIHRYKRISTAHERQQTKWVLAGILGTFAMAVPMGIITVAFPPSQPSLARLAFVYVVMQPIYLVSYLFMPISIVVAILRYRLWDIDLIIRRTLVYSVLSGLLGATYLGLVVGLQSVLRAFSGQGSQLAIVVSTLAIAALFLPLRTRVQAFIDRRFFRSKYNAEQSLARFSREMRDAVELGEVSDKLIDAVDGTLQPGKIVLWLPTGDKSKGSA